MRGRARTPLRAGLKDVPGGERSRRSTNLAVSIQAEVTTKHPKDTKRMLSEGIQQICALTGRCPCLTTGSFPSTSVFVLFVCFVVKILLHGFGLRFVVLRPLRLEAIKRPRCPHTVLSPMAGVILAQQSTQRPGGEPPLRRRANPM